MKYCPFKKKISYRDYWDRPISNTDKQITFEETSFMPCDKDQCMAYSNGDCLMINKICFSA